MTTIKTDDLTPRQINMIVAVAEGWVPPGDPLVQHFKDRWQVRNLDGRRWPRVMWLDGRDLTEAGWAKEPRDYCGTWAFSGPIIEREGIELSTSIDGNGWLATHGPWPQRGASGWGFFNGANAREAAMRAYVAQRYGEQITTEDKPWLLEAVPA